MNQNSLIQAPPMGVFLFCFFIFLNWYAAYLGQFCRVLVPALSGSEWRELLRLFVYVCLFCALLFVHQPGVVAHHTAERIRVLAEGPDASLAKVVTVPQLWTYLRSSFLPNILGLHIPLKSTSLTPREALALQGVCPKQGGCSSVLGFNVILNKIRFRQVRVSASPCTVIPKVDKTFSIVVISP